MYCIIILDYIWSRYEYDHLLQYNIKSSIMIVGFNICLKSYIT